MSQPRYYPNYTPVAATKDTDTQIKTAGGGVLGKVIVLVTGANPMQIYDSTDTSGNQIGGLPANPAVGAIFSFDVPCSLGITVKGNATNPGVVITWS